MSFSYYEFFAGGGMARMGLGEKWQCLFANDFCPKKAASYRNNFPYGNELVVDDVWNLSAEDMPAKADLAWASFPCQDLSLAGACKGLSAKRSVLKSALMASRVVYALQEAVRAVNLSCLPNRVG